jgi:hypothetical protein
MAWFVSEDTTLKIVPTNQSLILAGEPGGSGAGRSSSLFGQASQLIAGGGALRRVTILAARPDSAIAVQADYYSPDEAAPLDSALPAIAHSSPTSTALVAMNSGAVNRPAQMSSYNPIQLYLRTQRSLDDPRRAALLDVLA